MQIIKNIAQMKSLSESLRREKRIGFVPTMGFLHDGHLSLVRMAKRLSDVTVVSIFVNPIQFGPKEDYNVYPRDLQRDISLLEREGVDILFCPEKSEMYPHGYCTYVQVRGLEDFLCGIKRKGHFIGVATVVLKLFNIVKPHFSVFGEKDYQQLKIIERMVKDLNVDVEIIPHPTVREADGLAMSSRNTYLSSEERKCAPLIFKALKKGKELFENGISEAKTIKETIEGTLREEKIEIEYVSVCDPETLEEIEKVQDRALLAVACQIGKTRLIDNIVLRREEPYVKNNDEIKNP